ncbi:hypothetical protein AOQ84DRAFT_382766 [Glonium stellatum]|uniref:PWWP domain-containing protein n=1 Tax=Glonium stellatum TaxID=574774 RepID=A0A8E2EP68_9PEZI|nr:hypothetical protein AOQ84DRAFT_382766 [Glonium stellatum]
MADQAMSQASADTAKVLEHSTRPGKDSTEPTAVHATPTDDGKPPKIEQAIKDLKPVPNFSPPDTSKEIAMAEKTNNTGSIGEYAIVPERTTPINGTTASSKKGAKRKSGAGVPEHKKKNLNRKKSVPDLRLDVKPGEYWFVAMRGFPPWPVIVCDEEMLPETLLVKRPVSAMRIDGTYRDDFLEGGKNAKDRRYPIMFLGTNEFAWQVNTDLQPLDMDEIKRDVAENNQGKKTKALWEAYKVAADEHDLQWFKDMLVEHEKALVKDMEEKAAEDAKKQSKKDKTRRKSNAVDDEDDAEIEMDDVGEDGEAPLKKTKATKKRKKDADSDGETEKPAKTPKTKLKVHGPKTPKEESAVKPKKTVKPKKAKAKGESEGENESPKVEEKPMTEAERKEKREKGVLYLRHRLQKGFLTRDQTPKEEEMANMSDYFKQLEAYADLEAEIIRKTKIHKVLKAIIKLNSIPKEEEYQFKKRSNDLLNGWNRALAADVETPTTGEAPADADQSGEAATNGISHEEKPQDVNASDILVPTEDTRETAVAPKASSDSAGDGDTSMADAKDDVAVTKESEAPSGDAPETNVSV